MKGGQTMENSSFSRELFSQLNTLRKQVFAQFRDGLDGFCDLRPSEYWTLFQIGRNDSATPDGSGIPVSQICTMSHSSKSNVSQILKVLDKKDYIIRRPSPDDRRATLVNLTDAGVTLLDDIRAPGLGHFNTAARIMGPEKSRKLLSLLAEFNGAYHQAIQMNAVGTAAGDPAPIPCGPSHPTQKESQ